jgi:hypothetical protein
MDTPIKQSEIKRLFKLIDQNEDFDLQSANLLSNKTINSLNWKGLEKFKDQLVPHLKMYQRLQRVLTADDRVLISSLMQSNIHSAIQIASIPKSKFISNYGELFNNDIELIEKTYQKATAIRSQILIRHIAEVQKTEPHANVPKLKLN